MVAQETAPVSPLSPLPVIVESPARRLCQELTGLIHLSLLLAPSKAPGTPGQCQRPLQDPGGDLPVQIRSR